MSAPQVSPDDDYDWGPGPGEDDPDENPEIFEEGYFEKHYPDAVFWPPLPPPSDT